MVRHERLKPPAFFTRLPVQAISPSSYVFDTSYGLGCSTFKRSTFFILVGSSDLLKRFGHSFEQLLLWRTHHFSSKGSATGLAHAISSRSFGNRARSKVWSRRPPPFEVASMGKDILPRMVINQKGQLMDYGGLIRNERLKAGMTLLELSRLSGVPLMTIANWEYGHVPAVDKLDRVLEALGISITLGKK